MCVSFMSNDTHLDQLKMLTFLLKFGYDINIYCKEMPHKLLTGLCLFYHKLYSNTQYVSNCSGKGSKYMKMTNVQVPPYATVRNVAYGGTWTLVIHAQQDAEPKN
jgi:predicted metal-dependent RNase